MYRLCAGAQGEGIESPGNGVTGGCEPPDGVLETEPLKEQ